MAYRKSTFYKINQNNSSDRKRLFRPRKNNLNSTKKDSNLLDNFPQQSTEQEAYGKCFKKLNYNINKPKLYILDNECFNDLKLAIIKIMRSMNWSLHTSIDEMLRRKPFARLRIIS